MPALYTSVAHTKLALRNGGAPPPMMRLAAEWRERIDPEAVLGMGGLVEDKAKGLKCPMKGCDVWRHSLARHLLAAHGVTVDELRGALGLPKSIGLVSTAQHDRFVVAQLAATRNPKSIEGLRKSRGVGGHKNKGRKIAVGIRNLRGTCQAQLGEKLVALAEEAGHPPTRKEAIQIMGHGFLRQVERTYGTWNRAKASIGISAKLRMARTITPKMVHETWRAFYGAHGRYPSQRESQHGAQAPIIPSPNAVRHALGVRTWAEVVAIVEAARAAPELVA